MNLTIKEIFMSLWKSIYLIIVAAIVFTLVFGGVTYFLVEPEYTATTKLYVYNRSDGSLTQGDLNVSKSLVDTYLVIVKSNPVLEKAAQTLRSKYPDITAKGISEMLQGSAINETEAFYISATDPNRYKATDVVNTIVDIAPQEIIRVVKAASVEIIEEAILPEAGEYEWPLVRNIVMGFLLGVVLATVYIITSTSLNTTVYGRKEIVKNFTVPIVGAIPTMKLSEQKEGKGRIKNKIGAEDAAKRSFVLMDKTPFAVAEAYRMARTSIFYLPIESKCKKIAITSAVAAEGKSFCSINVTKVLAQAGKKVLLIDADMRKPRVARYLDIERDTGLSEYLAGIVDDLHIVHNDTLEADVLLSGNPSSSAAELLATSRLDKVFEVLESKYDYIIIDTPPINIVTDATILSGKIDGYLISVRAGMSDVEQMKEMLHSLEQLEARVFGVIVSDIDPKTETYGKYSYKNYKNYKSYKNYGYGRYSYRYGTDR